MSIRAQHGCRGLAAKIPVESFRNRYEETAYVARQIAASRTAAERWDARGKPEKAARSRAEEAEIVQNAKNFRMRLPRGAGRRRVRLC